MTPPANTTEASFSQEGKNRTTFKVDEAEVENETSTPETISTSTKDWVTVTPNGDASEEELVRVPEMVATSAPAENKVTATPKANSAASVADKVITTPSVDPKAKEQLQQDLDLAKITTTPKDMITLSTEASKAKEEVTTVKKDTTSTAKELITATPKENTTLSAEEKNSTSSTGITSPAEGNVSRNLQGVVVTTSVNEKITSAPKEEGDVTTTSQGSEGRISTTLKEDTTIKTTSTSAAVFTAPPSPQCECGEVSPGEPQPWQLRLVTPDQAEDSPRCGATLISPRQVLTAANCVLHFAQDKVQLSLQSGEGNTLDILTITNHPLFNESSSENDLTILTLKEPVNMKPICLPATSSVNGGAVVTATNLLQANVTLTSNSECQRFWKEDHISDSHLCAWIQAGSGRHCHSFNDAGDTVAVQENQRYPCNIGASFLMRPLIGGA